MLHFMDKVRSHVESEALRMEGGGSGADAGQRPPSPPRPARLRTRP